MMLIILLFVGLNYGQQITADVRDVQPQSSVRLQAGLEGASLQNDIDDSTEVQPAGGYKLLEGDWKLN